MGIYIELIQWKMLFTRQVANHFVFLGFERTDNCWTKEFIIHILGIEIVFEY